MGVLKKRNNILVPKGTKIPYGVVVQKKQKIFWYPRFRHTCRILEPFLSCFFVTLLLRKHQDIFTFQMMHDNQMEQMTEFEIRRIKKTNRKRNGKTNHLLC